MIVNYNELKNEIKSILQQVKVGVGSSGITNKVYILTWLIYQYKLKITCDLGVYYGGTLFPQAFIHNKYTNGIVYGIDPYTKEDAKQCEASPALISTLDDYIAKTDFDEIYNSVIELIKVFRYENNIVLLKQRSDAAIEYFKKNNIYFDLILIDGNHDTTNVVSDVNLYLPRVKENGYIILDDIHYQSVKPAYALVKSNTLCCYEEEYFAVFQKSKDVTSFKEVLGQLK